jgi:hypothetical protein
MAKLKAATRIEELSFAGTDYTMPIDAFAQKAMRMFNTSAKKAGLHIRVHAAEYCDDSARLYMSSEDCDSLSSVAAFLGNFSVNSQILANSNRALIKLELPPRDVTIISGVIYIDF